MNSSEVTDEIQRFLHYMPKVEKLFNVIDKIGEGTFSKVYRAQAKINSGEFALKYVVPTSHPSRIAGELAFLRELNGSKNIMKVSSCMLERGHVVIIMPYFPHDKFSDYVKKLTLDEIRDYLRNLLIALEEVHRRGIIHRDIKPSNFLFDRTLKRYALVDFGLAQRLEVKTPVVGPHSQAAKKRFRSQDRENEGACKKQRGSLDLSSSKVLQSLNNRINVTVHPVGSDGIKKPATIHKEVLWTDTSSRRSLGNLATTTTTPCNCFGKNTVCRICTSRSAEIAPRAGTPGFRAPEVLLKHKSQTVAIDIWSVGVIFLSLLSGRYPFFRATDDLTALAEIATLIGSERLLAAAETLGKKVTLSSQKVAVQYKTLCQKLRDGDPYPDVAYSLLDRLLDPSPTTRISASDALKHPFFETADL